MYLNSTTIKKTDARKNNKVFPQNIISLFKYSLPIKMKFIYNYNYWLDEWLKNIKPTVKESTYIRYKNAVNNHIREELGELNINKIDTEIIRDYVNLKRTNGKKNEMGGLSSKTISELITIIRSSFRYAESFGIYSSCCFDQILIKKENREIRVLSKNEEKRLLYILNKNTDEYKLGVLICLFTGIRIGELCALKWENINLEEKTIKIVSTMQRLQTKEHNSRKTHIVITDPKSYSSNRTIPLPNCLLKYLFQFKSSYSSFLLTGNDNTFVEPRTMQNRFKKYLREANIDNANFHALRHTFATRCIESGFDAKVLSEILGHSSVNLTLDKYVHSSMEHKRSNMQKLNMTIVV